MCGIAGFINFPDAAALAEKAGKIQQHRGPDNQDFWMKDNVCLVQQRLSIIDLEARANQPFVKGNLKIVFNGEIYNYKSLKSMIKAKRPDIVFTTESDTEVLLEMYRLKGIEMLQDLTGMFAFAIFDEDSGELFLARDHFGIKPLFYTFYNNKFAFSSELKTLLAIPDLDRAINMDAIVGCINYLWVPGNISCFKAIQKVPSAHYMLLHTNDVAIAHPEPIGYWQPPVNATIHDEQEAIERLKHELERSIERHMLADVPVSSFLSGGLDSSLISVMAAKHTGTLSTYTIGTKEEDKKVEQMPEDEVYAKKLANQFKFDHNEIIIDADIIDLLPKMVYHLDEPLGDPAAINTFLICEAARKKGVKVLLSGMGADEIFFGYRRHKAILIAEKYKKIPGLLRKLIAQFVAIIPVKIGGRGFRFGRWAKRFLTFSNQNTEEAYMRSYSYYDEAELGKMFKQDISAAYQNLRKQHATYFGTFNTDLNNKLCYTDLFLFMQGLNLTYTDRASMAASVEVRVPFIDKELVDFAMTIGGELKYKNQQSKYVLKKVAEEYLPHEIIYRPKAAFGAPIRAWISGPLKPLVNQLLSEESVNNRGLFKYEFVAKLIRDDEQGVEDNAYKIYMLLTVELWFKQFVDRKA